MDVKAWVASLTLEEKAALTSGEDKLSAERLGSLRCT
jgi:hypothetical protein